MSNTDIQTVSIDLDDDSTLTFEVDRKSYITFVNGANKNPFNAMSNLLSTTVCEDDRDRLRALVKNPANVSELCGAVIEDYTPDVAVVAKKRKSAAKK